MTIVSLVPTLNPAIRSPAPLLDVRNVEVVYHDVVFAVKGVSLTVAPGQVVTLFGPNGAGKTSLVRAISRLLLSVEAEIRSGSVSFDGHALDTLAPPRDRPPRPLPDPRGRERHQGTHGAREPAPEPVLPREPRRPERRLRAGGGSLFRS